MHQEKTHKIRLERVLERNRLLERILQLKEEEIKGLKKEINNNMADRDVVSMMLTSLLSELNFNNYSSSYLGNETNINKINQLQSLLLDALSDRKQAVSKDLLKSSFLAKMSHEIRTPMHGIIGTTNLLSKTILDEKQKKYLSAIQSSSNTLLAITNEILDISKIQAGKLTLENKPFNFKELLGSVISVFEGKAEENGIVLIKDYIFNDLPEILIGDSVRLSQILYNLISNAVKFTSEGTVTFSVKKVLVKESKSTMEFVISDTGIGISRDKQAYIFDEFTHVNEDTASEFGGTGLGLSIVKKLTDILGGRLSVKSKEGVGSSFTVELEFEIGNKSDLLFDNKESEVYDFSGLDILLVEDDTINQLVTKDLLESKKCNVTVVSNGKEAIDIINENNFQVVLMDMQMPVLDGYSTIKEIRCFGGDKLKLPIIALTAHTSQEAIERCFTVGADECLQKPYSAISLYEIIAEYSPKKVLEIENSNKVNYNFLLEYVDGNSTLANKILFAIKLATPKDILELKQAVVMQDWNKAQCLIHKIKPSIKMLGGNYIYIEMGEIEVELVKKESLDGLENTLDNLISKLTSFFN